MESRSFRSEHRPNVNEPFRKEMFYWVSRPPRSAADMLCLWLRVPWLEGNDGASSGGDVCRSDRQDFFRWWEPQWRRNAGTTAQSGNPSCTDANTASARAAES